jgi:hypothetical protein
MSETLSNIEYAHKIHEKNHGSSSSEWIEILEVVALAIVAVATAWSGYQAAKWDGHSAEQYSRASRATVQSQAKSAMAKQDTLYDVITFNGWVGAKLRGDETLTAFFERRFRPEWATAFAAWIKLDPMNNPSAPPGPMMMAEYSNANQTEAAKLEEEASHEFEHGVAARQTGDQYVKVTVLLATGLLLVALGQRFKRRGPRIVLVAIALTLLVGSTAYLAMLPRA